MSTAPSQTAAANQARRKRTEDKLRAVADAIQQMQQRRLPVTCPAIASRAGVSRTFLYDNPAARDLISAAIPAPPPGGSTTKLTATPRPRRPGSSGR
jgi:Family of unknown function (DUF6262)